jgi:Mn-containing catalase
MFHHVKELQFNARVSGPDPRFAKMLLDQFGGPNGELKAAMQYFVQAFPCRHAYPDKYDMLMDIATEEFSHLEIVGATVTMLLNGINGDLKNASERSDLMKLMKGKAVRDDFAHEAHTNIRFLTESGGGPMVTDANGVPWSGFFVNANGDLTVDLRSNIAAESRAKIVYEHLMQFTDDPYVKESLAFLMTREISHFQMFGAALADIQPNFPPGILQGDPRFTHVYYNMSNGVSVRGPWNECQGPWQHGEQWTYVEDPHRHVIDTQGQLNIKATGTSHSESEAKGIEKMLAKERSAEVNMAAPPGETQWTTYPTEKLNAPQKVQK